VEIDFVTEAKLAIESTPDLCSVLSDPGNAARLYLECERLTGKPEVILD
jgi:hypothetical protein